MQFLSFLQKYVTFEKQKSPLLVFAFLILISYSFSVGVRYIWVDQVKDTASYKWNDEIMINTNDGYYFAQGAKDILRGEKLYYASPTTTMTSKITAFFSKILPVSFETLILYLPAFLGSLLVFPILLIARNLNMEYAGFIGALIGSIAWSYYNRTMIGYYDTDMLNIVLPTSVLALLIVSIQSKQIWTWVALPIVMLFYTDWYNSGFFYLPLLLTALVYILVFDRKNIFHYQTLSVFMLSMANIAIEIKIALLIALIALFIGGARLIQKELFYKIIWIIFGLCCVLALTSGGMQIIYSQLEAYVFRKAVASDISLIFYNVAQTVREAGHIPFSTFANRISGGEGLLLLSSIGVILMIIRYPVLILSAPLIVVGFIALKGGLRFTVYTVPINALGMGFLIFLVTHYIKAILDAISIPQIATQSVRLLLVGLFTWGNLYPNIKHVKSYMVPTVFSVEEVKQLDELNKKTEQKDYVISWWDYGYPIRYYADAQTLVDGGIHGGDVNYPVSFALTKPMVPSANMLRLAVEYTESKIQDPRAGSVITHMIEDYKLKNVRDLLATIDDDKFQSPKPSRDIYLFLPYRMMGIFPTVSLFSNLDIETGRVYNAPLFFKSNVVSDDGTMITLSGGVKIPRDVNNLTGKIQISGKEYPIRYFIKTKYDNAGKLQKTGALYDKSSGINVIYMESYRQFLILDNASYYSTYVQLFVLEDDKQDLFEPVSLNPHSKIYKLKK